MKALVPIKRVIDYTLKVPTTSHLSHSLTSLQIRVAKSLKEVSMQNMRMSTNPFCDVAVE